MPLHTKPLQNIIPLIYKAFILNQKTALFPNVSHYLLNFDLLCP